MKLEPSLTTIVQFSNITSSILPSFEFPKLIYKLSNLQFLNETKVIPWIYVFPLKLQFSKILLYTLLLRPISVWVKLQL